MCRSMGSYFHRWIDYNGVIFLVELLYYNGVAHFRDFWGKKILVSRDLKIGRFAAKSDQDGVLDGNRIDYNGVGVLRGQRHIPSKN